MNNDVVLITGCTGLVGTQLVTYYLSVGTKVIGVSRSREKLEQLKNKKNDELFLACELDLEQDSAMNALQEFLGTHNEKPTSLICAARNTTYLKRGSKECISKSQWLGEYMLDVVVPYQLAMSLGNMQKSALNSVVLVSSMYGVVAQNPQLYDDPRAALVPQYGAAKAAQLQLTKDLATQLAPKGIRVNAVCLGGIEGKVTDQFKATFATYVPMGRMMKSQEAIGPIVFLNSKEAAYVTGSTYIVDGGWSAW